MVNKINFESFKKGDDIVITVLDDGNEETFSGKITNISLSKKVIHLEDDESEYECQFSEIKKISRCSTNPNLDLSDFLNFFTCKGRITTKTFLIKETILVMLMALLAALLMTLAEIALFVKIIAPFIIHICFVYGTSCLLKQRRNDYNMSKCVIGAILCFCFAGIFVVFHKSLLTPFIWYGILMITLYFWTKLSADVPETKIVLINKNKLLKECPVGFSWTTFFFGPFVPLTRGDLKWFVIMLIFAITIIGWVAMFVFCFKYNKLYIKDCLEKGYKPYDQRAVEILREMGIYYAK